MLGTTPCEDEKPPPHPDPLPPWGEGNKRIVLSHPGAREGKVCHSEESGCIFSGRRENPILLINVELVKTVNRESESLRDVEGNETRDEIATSHRTLLAMTEWLKDPE